MFENIALGALLTLITTAIHGICTAGLISFLRATHPGHWALRSTWARASVIVALVLGMFLISLSEAGIWAAAYTAAGAIQGFEEALYFSVVTFTTLGYGDVTLSEEWRLLASLQAADGTITFGWTTALIVAASHSLYHAEAELSNDEPEGVGGRR